MIRYSSESDSADEPDEPASSSSFPEPSSSDENRGWREACGAKRARGEGRMLCRGAAGILNVAPELAGRTLKAGGICFAVGLFFLLLI
jgi:hypothetical protein